MKLFLLGMVKTILVFNSFMTIITIIRDWKNWKIHRIILTFFLGIFVAVFELLDNLKKNG